MNYSRTSTAKRYRRTCPDCHSKKDIRRKSHPVVKLPDGTEKLIQIFQCQECGRTFRDFYRKGGRNRRVLPYSLKSLRVKCPQCHIPDRIVRFGVKWSKKDEVYSQIAQCRNCGRVFNTGIRVKKPATQQNTGDNHQHPASPRRSAKEAIVEGGDNAKK